MKGLAREVRVAGGGEGLAGALTDRFARLGHRVRRVPADVPVEDPAAELLIHLDSTLRGLSGPVGLERPAALARETFEAMERAVAVMSGRGFGRIVHLRSAPRVMPTPTHDGLPDGFASGGTVRMLQDLARREARFGITLNVVILTPPPSDGEPRAVQRQATWDEVAGLVEMLCADQAGFITAQCFPMVCNVS